MTQDNLTLEENVLPPSQTSNDIVNESEAASRHKPHFLMFFIKALLWGSVTLFLGNGFAVNPFWFVVVSVFLFSVPIVLCGVYGNTIRQIRRLMLFGERGRIYRLISNRSLKAIIWITYGLGTSFFMLVHFQTYSVLEWLVFFLVIPFFWIIVLIFRRILAQELKPFLVTNMALTWARRVCPFFMLFIYIVLFSQFGELQNYTSLPDAIEARQVAVATIGGSAVVQEVSQYLAIWEGVKAYAFGNLGAQDALLALVLLSIAGLIVFYNSCAILSCFLIPRTEYRRVFGPLTDIAIPSSLSNSRVAYIVGITTFITLFIYIPAFSYIEATLDQTPRIAEARQKAQAWAVIQLEQIEDAFFKEGTIAELKLARVEALNRIDVSFAHLEEQLDRAFDSLEGNVDKYLDWYYSLTAEYMRIVHILAGELEGFMEEKLREYLLEGDIFSEVQATLSASLSNYEETQRAYQQVAKQIMARNQVIPEDKSFTVVQHISLKDALHPPVHDDLITLESRLFGGGATAGIVSALILRQILTKVLSRNILRVATKALLRALATRTSHWGGAALGASAGAAIGSVVPFIGTTIGGIVGGVLGGISCGLAFEKGLLKIEESLSREKFRNEILAAIRETHMELKGNLTSSSEVIAMN